MYTFFWATLYIRLNPFNVKENDRSDKEGNGTVIQERERDKVKEVYTTNVETRLEF